MVPQKFLIQFLSTTPVDISLVSELVLLLNFLSFSCNTIRQCCHWKSENCMSLRACQWGPWHGPRHYDCGEILITADFDWSQPCMIWRNIEWYSHSLWISFSLNTLCIHADGAWDIPFLRKVQVTLVLGEHSCIHSIAC